MSTIQYSHRISTGSSTSTAVTPTNSTSATDSAVHRDRPSSPVPPPQPQQRIRYANPSTRPAPPLMNTSANNNYNINNNSSGSKKPDLANQILAARAASRDTISSRTTSLSGGIKPFYDTTSLAQARATSISRSNSISRPTVAVDYENTITQQPKKVQIYENRPINPTKLGAGEFSTDRFSRLNINENNLYNNLESQPQPVTSKYTTATTTQSSSSAYNMSPSLSITSSSSTSNNSLTYANTNGKYARYNAGQHTAASFEARGIVGLKNLGNTVCFFIFFYMLSFFQIRAE